MGTAVISPHALIGSPPEHKAHRHHHTGWTTALHDPFFPIIGAETLIEAFVTVDSGTYQPTTIGARSYLMKGVHVGHDTHIGQECRLAPHAAIGGSVWIDNFVYVGMCATVRPFTSVGRNSVIGQGAAVVCHVPPYQCWGGVPARKLYDICFECGERVRERRKTGPPDGGTKVSFGPPAPLDPPTPLDPQPAPPAEWLKLLRTPHDFTALGIRCLTCAEKFG